MRPDVEEVIEHFGVKGMKWGVRKDPDRVAARKQANMEKKEKIKKYVGETTSSLTTRAKEQKHKFQTKRADKKEKRADKKWSKHMTDAKMQKEMAYSNRRTRRQQRKLRRQMYKSDLYKKAQSGDRQAMQEFNNKWTMEHANVLNQHMSKQAKLKSPSGKKAVEVTVARIGDEPFMTPRIVDKE